MNIKKLTGKTLLLIIFGFAIDAFLIWWGYSFIKNHLGLTIAIVIFVIIMFVIGLFAYKKWKKK